MGENPEYGVQDPGLRGPGVWKTRGVKHGVDLVKNKKTMTGLGKHGVWWKTRGLSGKHGVQVKNTGEPLFRLQ